MQEALADGVFVEVFENRCPELSRGKPIVATAHIMAELSLAAIQEIGNDYVAWRRQAMLALPAAEQLFTTTLNSEEVWVIEDGHAFTVLYPEDY